MSTEINFDEFELPYNYNFESEPDAISSPIKRFIEKSKKEANGEGFSSKAFLKAFEDYLEENDKELKNKKTLFSKTDYSKEIEKNVKNLARTAGFYDETPSYDNFKEYNSKGKKAIEMFLKNAHEAQVNNKTLAESYCVLASLAGFEVDASKIKLSDFRGNQNDFNSKAEEIVKKSLNLPEPKIEEEELSDEERFERAVNGVEGMPTKLNINSIEGAQINDKSFMEKNLSNFQNQMGTPEVAQRPKTNRPS